MVDLKWLTALGITSVAMATVVGSAWAASGLPSDPETLAAKEAGTMEPTSKDGGGWVLELAAKDAGVFELAAKDAGVFELAAKDARAFELAAKDAGAFELAAKDAGVFELATQK
jgi:hypothetical protein